MFFTAAAWTQADVANTFCIGLDALLRVEMTNGGGNVSGRYIVAGPESWEDGTPVWASFPL